MRVNFSDSRSSSRRAKTQLWAKMDNARRNVYNMKVDEMPWQLRNLSYKNSYPSRHTSRYFMTLVLITILLKK